MTGVSCYQGEGVFEAEKGEVVESKARVMGHPIHPILVTFPIGLLTASVLFDVVHLLTGGARWAEISFWLIAVGVVGGLLAAVFGLVDWLSIPSGTRAKTVGLAHGLSNVLMVALFAVSWLLRSGAPEEPGLLAIVLSFLGVGLVSLGGELVFRLGIGVAEGANPDAPASVGSPTGTRTAELLASRLPCEERVFAEGSPHALRRKRGAMLAPLPQESWLGREPRYGSVTVSIRPLRRLRRSPSLSALLRRPARWPPSPCGIAVSRARDYRSRRSGRW